MSAALAGLEGTLAGALTAAGCVAGFGLEATEELSQPAAASAKATSNNRLQVSS